MKREWNVFLSAVMFFTRVPVRLTQPYSDDLLSKSTKYLPLLGLAIGGVGAIVYWLACYVFPESVAVLLSMIATILVTGAFHEDGFADVCDAFGGGWTKDKVLEIMKDSRVGAYGMIGMCLLLSMKFTVLKELSPNTVPYLLISGHCISRWAATSIVFTHVYARSDASSKSKPVAKKLDTWSYVLATVVAVASLSILPLVMFGAFVAVIIAKYWFIRYVHKWIGGYTGDVLGAVQQITEVVFYLVALGLITLQL